MFGFLYEGTSAFQSHNQTKFKESDKNWISEDSKGVTYHFCFKPTSLFQIQFWNKVKIGKNDAMGEVTFRFDESLSKEGCKEFLISKGQAKTQKTLCGYVKIQWSFGSCGVECENMFSPRTKFLPAASKFVEADWTL